ncbi:MAG: hypothetical protein IJ538_02125 [Clostridia bacterium]|nr:hypothetical protein [Clostridia bacterium]
MCLFYQKKHIFISNFALFKETFNLRKKLKINKIKIQKTIISTHVYSSLHAKITPLTSQKFVLKNKKFLIEISKKIEDEINSNTHHYKSIGSHIYLYELANLSAMQIYYSNKPVVFKFVKANFNRKFFHEEKTSIFKFLLGERLLFLMCEINNELNKISKIITKSAKIKKFKLLKNQLYNCFEIYSIFNFNPNANKILNPFVSYKNSVLKAFCELQELQSKLNTIVLYLLSIFK